MTTEPDILGGEIEWHRDAEVEGEKESNRVVFNIDKEYDAREERRVKALESIADHLSRISDRLHQWDSGMDSLSVKHEGVVYVEQAEVR